MKTSQNLFNEAIKELEKEKEELKEFANELKKRGIMASVSADNPHICITTPIWIIISAENKIISYRNPSNLNLPYDERKSIKELLKTFSEIIGTELLLPKKIENDLQFRRRKTTDNSAVNACRTELFDRMGLEN